MKVWITKNALTEGILEKDGEENYSCKGMMKIKGERVNQVEYYFGEGREWHLNKESAIKKAEEMRIKKIASLKQKIKKMGDLKFV